MTNDVRAGTWHRQDQIVTRGFAQEGLGHKPDRIGPGTVEKVPANEEIFVWVEGQSVKTPGMVKLVEVLVTVMPSVPAPKRDQEAPFHLAI